MKSVCNVNRTGKVSSGTVTPGGDFPYDPAAPEYSGFAILMSETGALLDVPQISGAQAADGVYVMFGRPVTGASVVTYAVTHIGVVLRASESAVKETSGTRKATIEFAPLLKVGQGQESSCFTNSQWRVWNAKLFPVTQMLSSQVVFRPAYDYAVSDENEVTTSAQWTTLAPEPHTGTLNVIRNVPAESPDALRSRTYNAITFDLFYTVKSVAVRPEPGNLMCCALVSINETDEELLSYANYTAPAAVVETPERTDLYWLAWHKPSGSSACTVCLLRSTADAVPQDTVEAASPVVITFWTNG